MEHDDYLSVYQAAVNRKACQALRAMTQSRRTMEEVRRTAEEIRWVRLSHAVLISIITGQFGVIVGLLLALTVR